MAETEVEMTITVGEGKYTFFIFKDDYRIHCWRYNEPWMVFTQGHKAISSLMYSHEKLMKALQCLVADHPAGLLPDKPKSLLQAVQALKGAEKL